MNKEDKILLLKLICDKQIEMIAEDNTQYESDLYIKLEELKIKVKNID